MFDLLKLLISKDFIANAKDILSLINRSKDWKKDIVHYSGTFLSNEKMESSVFINETLKLAEKKGWDADEIGETRFIFQELFDNAFNYGLPGKDAGSIKANALITSTFLRFKISDNGQFDLLAELENQEALIPDSDKHKGLSFINKITPEITQERTPDSNTIILIKRQGLKPLKIKKDGDVIVFDMGSSIYINEANYRVFTERVEQLTHNAKVLIDFGGATLMASRAARDLRSALSDVKSGRNIKMCVCGLTNAPFAIREFFEAKMPTFETYDDAMMFLAQG